MSESFFESPEDVTDVNGAKRRLQATREALMHQMVRSTSVAKRSGVPDLSLKASPRMGENAAKSNQDDVGVKQKLVSERQVGSSSNSQAQNAWVLVKHAFNAWWQFHPARAVIAIAEPFLEEFAARKPGRLVGISFGIGIALAIARPWRLLSVGGLALAALKSSRVSGAALGFLSEKARKA